MNGAGHPASEEWSARGESDHRESSRGGRKPTWAIGKQETDAGQRKVPGTPPEEIMSPLARVKNLGFGQNTQSAYQNLIYLTESTNTALTPKHSPANPNKGTCRTLPPSCPDLPVWPLKVCRVLCSGPVSNKLLYFNLFCLYLSHNSSSTPMFHLTKVSLTKS